jgi:hypothetical protein
LQVHAGPPMTVFFKDIVLESYPKREAGKAREAISPVKKRLAQRYQRRSLHSPRGSR